jgi:2-oxoglutarate ferredoxin oxidoreductase subunit gamma
VSRYEIRIGGFGGQGVVTMAVVLGETLSLIEKKFVVQTQSYGPEARGGASKSEIVVGDVEIDYPKVLQLASLNRKLEISKRQTSSCWEFFAQ